MRFPLCALLGCGLMAQTPLSFDVATVKPTAHGRTADGWSRSSADIASPGRFVAQNSSLSELIRFAYEIKDYQLAGPAWLNDDSESFDIEAKSGEAATNAEMRAMVQSLLKDRFAMAAHRETRVARIYELRAAEKGPKLPAPVTSPGHASTSSAGGEVAAWHVSMPEFAYQLSRWLEMPVIDRTGIIGAYDFDLHYSPRDSGERPSIFAALSQQLGLRLESAKGPVEVLVVDHIERKPTEN